MLGTLDDYRGASRFTTWAYKFALLESGVRLRRRAWQEREVVLEPKVWPLMDDAGQGPEGDAEMSELMGAITGSIDGCLTGHQGEVLVALALNGMPLDVLADRLNTNRGAALQDASRPDSVSPMSSSHGVSRVRRSWLHFGYIGWCADAATGVRSSPSIGAAQSRPLLVVDPPV